MKLSRRIFLSGASAAAFVFGAQQGRAVVLPGAFAGWYPLKTGGGGQVTAVFVSTDGAIRLAATDTAGTWKQNTSTKIWSQVLTRNSLPKSLVGSPTNFVSGTYSLAIAPSDHNRIYLGHNIDSGGESTAYVLRSDDGGGTFIIPGKFSGGMWGPNESSYKLTGPKMMVDPVNRDVVYVGTPHGGQFLSADAGVTWSRVPNVPASAGGLPAVGFAFDTTSGTSTGALAGKTEITRTNTVWIASQGAGVWRSTDGGTSFSLVSGGPTSVRNARISATGVYYAVQADSIKLWRYNGAWADKTPAVDGNGLDKIVMTSVAKKVLAVTAPGKLLWSADSGDSWSALPYKSSTYTAPRIGWMNYIEGAAAPGNYMSVGDLIEDPTTPGTLILAHGIGVATSTSTSGPPVWVDQSEGIEQLVNNQIIAPPGEPPMACYWDRPFFRYPDPAKYPRSYGPDGPKFPHSIEFGWSIAYSVSSPSTIHLLGTTLNGGTNSSYSRDSGITWKRYANLPSFGSEGYLGGSIASSTPDHVVMAPGQGASMYYSTNATLKSATWTQLMKSAFSNGSTPAFVLADQFNTPILGVAAGRGGVVRFTVSNTGTLATGAAVQPKMNGTGDLASINYGIFVCTVVDSTHIELQGTRYSSGSMGSGPVLAAFTGWGSRARYIRKRSVVASQVTRDKYIAINDNTAGLGGGTYVSLDAGANWVRQGIPPSNAAGAQLKMVLGSGDLFQAYGFSGNNQLFFSRDDGASWVAVTCARGIIADTIAVGTGKIKPGNDYPSVYFVGSIGGVYGAWQSDNSAAQWAAMRGILFTNKNLPADCVGGCSDIEGNSDTHGKFYVGFGSNGVMAYSP